MVMCKKNLLSDRVSEFTSTDTKYCLGTSGSCLSEKLGIAFGLARTPEGTCSRIVKNLRVQFVEIAIHLLLFPKHLVEK